MANEPGQTPAAPAPVSSPATSAPAAAPAISAPAAAPTKSQTQAQRIGLSAEAERVLNFNPSSDGGAAPASPSVPVSPTSASPTDPNMSVDGGGATPKPTAPAGLQSPNPELVLMQRQLAEANALVEQLKRGGVQTPNGAMAPQGTAPAPQGQPESDPLPPYNFNFPEPLVNLIRSEDPRDTTQGLTLLAAGVARGIHHTVMQQVMTQVAPQLIQAAVRQVQSQQSAVQEQQSVRNDFYSTYKEFDQPQLHDFVMAQATQLAAELRVQQYSPEFRDALANRLRAVLQIPASPRQVFMPGGSAARTPAPQLDPQQAQVMDLMI